MSRLRINIRGRNDLNDIVEKRYPRLGETPFRLVPEVGPLASLNVRVVFEPSALKPLFEHIAWGDRVQGGEVERAGLLIGNFYRDRSQADEVIWGDVITVVPADPSLVEATPESIDITPEAWEKMRGEAEGFRSENLQVLGWYHTRLGQITRLISGLDRKTQRIALSHEYGFGVVFNPSQRKWSAFFGPDSRECHGELLLDEVLRAKHEKPRISANRIKPGQVMESGATVGPTERRPPGRGIPETGQGGELSLGQLFGQFFRGLGLLAKGARDQNGETAEAFPANGTAYGNPAINQETRPGRLTAEGSPWAPAIGSRDATHPDFQCRLYSISPDERCSQGYNFECLITEKMAQEIINCQPVRITNKWSLWGLISKSNGDKFKLSFASEREANARILFAGDVSERSQIEFLATGLRKLSKDNIRFIIFINEAYASYIEAQIVYFMRERIP